MNSDVSSTKKPAFHVIISAEPVLDLKCPLRECVIESRCSAGEEKEAKIKLNISIIIVAKVPH